MPRIDMTRRTALYRLFDEKGRLLYVGIAFDPPSRWAGHAAVKSWWGNVAEKQVEWHATRTAAAAAEVEAIRTEAPLYNVADSEDPYIGGTTKQGAKSGRMLRIDDATWEDYKQACAADGTTASDDIRRFVHGRVNQRRES